jgi:hypothetical protein
MEVNQKITHFLVLEEEKIVSIVMDCQICPYQKLFYSREQTAKEKDRQLALARFNLFGTPFTCIEKKKKDEQEIMVIGELLGDQKHADRFVLLAKEMSQREAIHSYRELLPEEIIKFKNDYFYLFPEFFLLQGT